MSRIVVGDDARRVYSYLGLDRAPRRCMGMGLGVSFGDASFSPLQLGPAAFYCTNTAAFPGARVLATDPCVNGTFAVDATWTKGANWTIDAGVAKHAAVGANDLSQACLAIGNTYAITYDVVQQSAGNITVYAGTTAGTARSAAGTYTETLVCATNTTLAFKADAACDAWIDNVVLAPQNVATFTDLSGNGRHLVQATAANQPLLVASGSGGYLSFDTSDIMTFAAPWAQVNPTTVYALVRRPSITDVERHLLYPDAGAACRIAVSDNGAGAGNQFRAYSNDCYPITTFEQTAWHVLRARWNATLGGVRVDSGAEVTEGGTPTYSNWLSMGRAAGRLEAYVAALVIIHQDMGLAANAANDARMMRWLARQKAMLAL